MFKNKNKKGLSLIEVMIIIAIIGIMSAISIVSFNASRRDAALETAAEELVSVLREAQNYALTGKEATSACNSYRVNLVASGASYNLVMPPVATCGAINLTYSFKNGVTPSVAGWINFTAPHGNITRTAGAVVGNWYRVTLSKSGASYYVCFNSAGLIKKTTDANCN